MSSQVRQLPPTIANDLADVPPAGVKMAKPNGDHARMLETGRWKVMCSFPFAVIRTSAMPDAGT